MDQMGVDIQAISVVPPQYFYWAEPQVGAKLSGMVNDRLFEIVQGHPDRFVGLGTLPLQDVDLALGELERVVEDLRFDGLEICTNVNGVDFDDPRFVPFFEKVVEHDLLLVVHPNGFTQGERLADYYLINTLGMPMDSTVFVARMIFGGVLERFPTLKVCVTHGGGYLPFYPARFDHAYEQRDDCREHISRPPSTYLAQMYFDTMVFDPDMLVDPGEALGRRPRAPGHGLSVRHGRDRSARVARPGRGPERRGAVADRGWERRPHAAHRTVPRRDVGDRATQAPRCDQPTASSAGSPESTRRTFARIRVSASACDSRVRPALCGEITTWGRKRNPWSSGSGSGSVTSSPAPARCPARITSRRSSVDTSGPRATLIRYASVLHRPQGIPVDQSPGGVGQRRAEDDGVGLAQQGADIHEPHRDLGDIDRDPAFGWWR